MPRYRFGNGSDDDWEVQHQGNKTLRFIFTRAWVLIVPLIAVGWYNARYVVPMAKRYDQQIAAIKARGDSLRTHKLTESRKVGIGLSMLRALSDTFQVRFARIDSLIDSVSVLRSQDQAEVQRLTHQGDSLRTTYSTAVGKADSLSKYLPPMQARIDSLRAAIADQTEQIRKLEAEKQADLDVADRVLNPNKYHKNSALVTGEGDFPNRDALPKR
jgi:hypothetical protein